MSHVSNKDEQNALLQVNVHVNSMWYHFMSHSQSHQCSRSIREQLKSYSESGQSFYKSGRKHSKYNGSCLHLLRMWLLRKKGTQNSRRQCCLCIVCHDGYDFCSSHTTVVCALSIMMAMIFAPNVHASMWSSKPFMRGKNMRNTHMVGFL